jgi:hypothetical protein
MARRIRRKGAWDTSRTYGNVDETCREQILAIHERRVAERLSERRHRVAERLSERRLARRGRCGHIRAREGRCSARRARRASSSSRTSSADPGDDPPGDQAGLRVPGPVCSRRWRRGRVG